MILLLLLLLPLLRVEAVVTVVVSKLTFCFIRSTTAFAVRRLCSVVVPGAVHSGELTMKNTPVFTLPRPRPRARRVPWRVVRCPRKRSCFAACVVCVYICVFSVCKAVPGLDARAPLRRVPPEDQDRRRQGVEVQAVRLRPVPILLRQEGWWREGWKDGETGFPTGGIRQVIACAGSTAGDKEMGHLSFSSFGVLPARWAIGVVPYGIKRERRVLDAGRASGVKLKVKNGERNTYHVPAVCVIARRRSPAVPGTPQPFSLTPPPPPVIPTVPPPQDRRGMEGALRGDKGIRDEDDLPTLSYFKRALGLARPHWPFFVAAFACLALSNTARIALPNFQGGILDK